MTVVSVIHWRQVFAKLGSFEGGEVAGAAATHDDHFREARDDPLPTLLMPGDQDVQYPHWVMRRQLARIPHAEFIVLPEASHWEQPEAFNRDVLEFIRKY
jgi:pimeloyl-ACP methyl ester carboxylesterase